MKLFERIKFNKEREIRIMNVPIIHYGTFFDNGIKEKYFEIFPKSFEHKTLDKILEMVDSNHDHIWIVRTVGLGEANLLNYVIDGLNLEFGAKSPCLVSHRKIYKELFEMYNKIPFYYLDIQHNDYAFNLRNRNIKYRNRYFHVWHCTIQESLKWLKSHQDGDNTHTVNAIYKWWNINENKIQLKSQNFNKETINHVNNVIKDLNLKNFIFIIPESNGTDSLPVEFWENMTNEFNKEGYDVFVNTKSGDSPFGKCVQLNIMEATYMASLATAIVGLRTGLIEVMASLENRGQLHALYPNFRTMKQKQFQATYTLLKYPFKNTTNIFEYLIEDKSYLDIISKIKNKIINI